jgi:hypothetical protein
MSLVLDFDPLNNILRMTVKGRLRDANLYYGYEAVARYVASHSPGSGIIDFSAVTEVEVSTDAVRQLTKRPPMFQTGCREIVVAPRSHLYALSRMFQILGEETHPDLHIVHTMDEAYQLLYIQAPEFVPVSWAQTG